MSGHVVEAFFVKLALTVHLVNPEYGLNPCDFPLANSRARGMQFALTPLYFGSLYAWMDEHVCDVDCGLV